MKNEVTIVTAFKDLDRGNWAGTINGRQIPPYIKRDRKTYFERFSWLTGLNNKIICFAETKFHDELREIAINKENLILLEIDDIYNENFYLKKEIINVQKNRHFLSFVDNPSLPEYWNSDYVLINYMKSWLVDHAASNDLINTDNAAWIDFGYCREKPDAPLGKTFCFDTKNKINLFSNGNMSDDEFIIDLVKTNKVLIQGCHIIAPPKKFFDLYLFMRESAEYLLRLQIIDDDQTMLYMSYLAYKNSFIVNKNDPNDWFNVIRNNCV